LEGLISNVCVNAEEYDRDCFYWKEIAMKRRSLLVGWVVFMILVGTGCAPSTPEKIIPTQTSPTATIPMTTEIPFTETPALVPAADLSMEIGSTYAYVDGSLLVAVPEGEFLMGGDSDTPEHNVFLSDFWIYSTEVTNQQYSLCESLGECTPPDPNDNPSYADRLHANDPVVGVTYDQASSYCSFVNGRLPTEAEWEKAARNTDGDLYPWGDAMPTCDLLNFNNCVGNTTNVINYKADASLYGAMDMAGNVFEWVADWFDANYYDSSPGENPQGPASGTMRSVRSSSYESDADQAAVMIRNAEDPKSHRSDLGFRCVVDEPTYFAPFCTTPFVYGNESAQASQETCPELDIEQAQYCVGKLPLTNVTFTGPAESAIDPSNCVPSDDPNLFTCQSPGTVVSIAAECRLNEIGAPSCPDGFTEKNGTCVADGATGQCLAGNYDSSQQCCDVSSQQSDVLALSQICPVGTFYAMGENACLPYPVQGILTVSLDVGFTSCNVVGGGGGGGEEGGESGSEGTCCQEPAGGCGLSEFWDPVQCCCTVDGNSCSYKPSCP
jgi:formylglycine-generating enzyme required for sulfatase activity